MHRDTVTDTRCRLHRPLQTRCPSAHAASPGPGRGRDPFPPPLRCRPGKREEQSALPSPHPPTAAAAMSPMETQRVATPRARFHHPAGSSRSLPAPPPPPGHTPVRNNARPRFPARKRRCPSPTASRRDRDHAKPGRPRSPRTRWPTEAAVRPLPLTGNEWSGGAGGTIRREPRAPRRPGSGGASAAAATPGPRTGPAGPRPPDSGGHEGSASSSSTHRAAPRLHSAAGPQRAPPALRRLSPLCHPARFHPATARPP
ncbi:serine/arginine repetitive matrix protein 1-like [Zonotrichia leucophrys gambelii]|uniref:serine/arginine repetitive matrix protein 1-like n=1 Tax=Zonotrichia leucophrys gambelii TaxID=257770 RepID=UPI0031403EA1